MTKGIRLLLFAAFIHLAATASAQITNPGFELVDTGATDTAAQHWAYNDFGSGLTTHAHTGNYAMSVWNWYYYAQGFAVNGNTPSVFLPAPGSPYLYNGEPISFKPLHLQGYYMYDTTQNGGMLDTAVIQITLSRYNTGSGAREAVGFGEARLTAASNYTAFTAPVTYSSALMPDTVVVAIISSTNGFCQGGSDGNCLYFTVDDLFLSSPAGLVDFSDKAALVNVYPNPAGHLLNIDASHINQELSRCSIIDINGSTVLTQALTGNRALLDVSMLQAGFYFYRLNTHSGQTVYTGKVTITR